MIHATKVLVVSPNWLGDAVMALPAIDDVRRQFPSAHLAVAARPAVADLFTLVPTVDEIITLKWRGRIGQRELFAADSARLREASADLAILLPNSFAAAWLVRRAGIPMRCGYRGKLRARLLTRAVPRPTASMHQGVYYQRLMRELGIDSGPLEPVVAIPDSVVLASRAFLRERGWDESRALVAFAGGAAYGSAKRWIPAYAAALVAELVERRSATCVLVGSRGDTRTAREIVAFLRPGVAPSVIDLTGQTTIPMLAGVLHLASACVSNDSGAMHLAAAIGTPVVALFGPTNEYETAPLTRHGHRSVVLTHRAWCRPCMLRECPIDHRCMTGIGPERVYDAVAAMCNALS